MIENYKHMKLSFKLNIYWKLSMLLSIFIHSNNIFWRRVWLYVVCLAHETPLVSPMRQPLSRSEAKQPPGARGDLLSLPRRI